MALEFMPDRWIFTAAQDPSLPITRLRLDCEKSPEGRSLFIKILVGASLENGLVRRNLLARRLEDECVGTMFANKGYWLIIASSGEEPFCSTDPDVILMQLKRSGLLTEALYQAASGTIAYFKTDPNPSKVQQAAHRNFVHTTLRDNSSPPR